MQLGAPPSPRQRLHPRVAALLLMMAAMALVRGRRGVEAVLAEEVGSAVGNGQAPAGALFSGARKGYYFGTGKHGLGYYKDRHQRQNPHSRDEGPLRPRSDPDRNCGGSEEAQGDSGLRKRPHGGGSGSGGEERRRAPLAHARRTGGKQPKRRLKSRSKPSRFVDLQAKGNLSAPEATGAPTAPTGGTVAGGRARSFIPSAVFAGPRPGYYFARGPSGVGYYLFLAEVVVIKPRSKRHGGGGGIVKAEDGRPTFAGRKPGFYFGLGAQGLGYYRLGAPAGGGGHLVRKADDEPNSDEEALMRQGKEDPPEMGAPGGNMIRVIKDQIVLPREWEGVVDPVAAAKHLQKNGGGGKTKRFRNLFIPLPRNQAPRFGGWKLGYYFGTGDEGTGYYRDFYQDLLLVAKQQQLKLNGTYKTLEQLKIEELERHGFAARGIGSKRFGAVGGQGQLGLFNTTIEVTKYRAPDGTEYEMVATGTKLSNEAIGLPLHEDKPEGGRIAPATTQLMESIKSHALLSDGTDVLNPNLLNQTEYRTQAEIDFDNRFFDNIEHHREMKWKGMNYRERIDAFNRKLASQTEFNDLFKIEEPLDTFQRDPMRT